MRIDAGGVARRRLGLTPLVDVIFLLLLFFMLSSSFLKYAEIDVDAALRGASKAAETRLVILKLRGDGAIEVNGEVVSRARLLSRLDQLATTAQTTTAQTTTAQARLAVFAAEGADVQGLVALLETARKSRFKTIMLAP